MSKCKKKTIVLGVGNILLQDEGIGVYVAQKMEKLELPSHVEVIDGGTAAMELLPVIEKADRLIVVDAIEAGSEPGAIFKFTPEDIRPKVGKDRVSLHEIGLLESLDMIKQTGGKYPQTVIFGVQPKTTELEMGLSPELKKKVPQIVKLVLKEIGC